MPEWSAYQQCPQCGAGLGKPCREMSGFVVGRGEYEVEIVEAHSTRPLRAESARKEAGR